MEQEQLLKTNFFTTEEWDLTPKRVKQFVVQQEQRIEELEKQLENLQEKVNCNSTNSSIPPSTEIVKPEKCYPLLLFRYYLVSEQLKHCSGTLTVRSVFSK